MNTRWNYCLWPSQPWHNLKWRNAWKVGDMYFVLPSMSGYPVETLRFEALRLGIQDYELLRLAESILNVDDANRLFDEIRHLLIRTDDFSNFNNPEYCRSDLYSIDPQDYENARNLVIDAIATFSVPTSLEDMEKD